jgi:hypothetical protein
MHKGRSEEGVVWCGRVQSAGVQFLYFEVQYNHDKMILSTPNQIANCPCLPLYTLSNHVDSPIYMTQPRTEYHF